MVRASNLVASLNRRSARPVGAPQHALDALGGQDAQDGVDDRRLAHPRPAVMTTALEASANRTASAWPAASDRPLFLSTQGSALSAAIAG